MSNADFDSDKEGAARRARLKELSEHLGMPVIAVVSRWQGDYAVNLDESAARAFFYMLDAQIDPQNRESSAQSGNSDDSVDQNEPEDHEDPTGQQAQNQPNELGLFLVGRGGFTGFADSVLRAAAGWGLKLTVIIPERVDGALSLISLGASRRIFHPYGALGAFDRPAHGREQVQELVQAYESAQTEKPPHPLKRMPTHELTRSQQIANSLLGRIVASGHIGANFLDLFAALGHAALGTQLGLGAGELSELGVPTTLAASPEAALIRQIFCAYERALGLLKPPTPRYIASDIADEVEFAPAEELVGAIIESAGGQLVYELDTGRPDPDSGLLDGRWRWPDESPIYD